MSTVCFALAGLFAAMALLGATALVLAWLDDRRLRRTGGGSTVRPSHVGTGYLGAGL